MTSPAADHQSRWLIYALGGGMGHVTRAIALARQAARRGIPTRILSNSQFLSLIRRHAAPLIKLDEQLIQLVEIPSWLGPDAVAELTRKELLRCGDQDVLIVDTFPRGLGGELKKVLNSVQCEKVFIHRNLRDEYVRWGRLEECRSDYNLIIVPGETAPLENLADARTEPWLICDADELLPRDSARQVCGIEAANTLPLIVVTGCGTSEEARFSAVLAGRICGAFRSTAVVRFSSLDPVAMKDAGELAWRVWPLMKVLPGIDLLIGAGGYNTVNEARACGVPLLAIPQSRLYDQQAERLNATERVVNEDALIERIAQRLETTSNTAVRPMPSYTNGTATAFELINCRRLMA